MDANTNQFEPEYKTLDDIGSNKDLEELQNAEGIKVWGAEQEVLENQALKELEAFARENEKTEDGEITEDPKSEPEKPKIRNNFLDIDSYIKKQDELKKRQEHARSLLVSEKSKIIAEKISKQQRKRRKSNDSDCNIRKKKKTHTREQEKQQESDSEYFPSDESDNEGYISLDGMIAKKRQANKDLEKIVDDGSIKCYKARLKKYYDQLEREKSILGAEEEESEEQIYHIGNGLKIQKNIWRSLYSYQQDGIEWLWELHQKKTGGLLGDEMGLGKTVQVITFLHALNYSGIISGLYKGLGPTLIVSPATVIHQWVKHFHEWTPEFRVAVLHTSGSYIGNKINLIKEIHKDKSILISTYQGILKYKGLLVERNWHYVILDEGHKIRNPEAKVSQAVKEIRTPHRLILTGSPMQNNLQELWSLFDFVNPGLLGSLKVFMEHFANPIMQGGYANATEFQEATALSVATALKDMISPHLLRRLKNDVKKLISLPNKSEQVLFCSLTDEQKDLYKGYLMSEHINMILGRGKKNWQSEKHIRANVLMAITTLRKICNHPDLYLGEFEENNHLHEQGTETPLPEKFGYYKRSGKMIVVSALLKIWKKQGHRVLLFTQSRLMVAIFEEFLSQQGYTYLKMDGSTSVQSRQPLIEKFNRDGCYDVFLLTTRVGGLGVNLTGANRVIIFDPDWNPATDTQARERAWRIGQEKQVTIYRLLTAGTIEEKMYQRQVWKQLLSNKVLIDPKTQRFFKNSDLHDLFSLQEQTGNTETSNIFRNSKVKIEEKINRSKSHKERKKIETDTGIQFSEDKIQAMKILAQKIAKGIGKQEQPKSDLEKELEEERKKRMEEKEFLKTLSPAELREYNRRKLEATEEEEVNKIDDRETVVSFSKALEISEKTAELYHNRKEKGSSSKECTTIASNLSEDSGNESYLDKKKHKSKKKGKLLQDVDLSGRIDGVTVEGLLKREVKTRDEGFTDRNESSKKKQDDYVLGKLFAKSGVHTALQHDIIVQSNCPASLKTNYEAKVKAEKALEALRKSRINNWRW